MIEIHAYKGMKYIDFIDGLLNNQKSKDEFVKCRRQARFKISAFLLIFFIIFV